MSTTASHVAGSLSASFELRRIPVNDACDNRSSTLVRTKVPAQGVESVSQVLQLFAAKVVGLEGLVQRLVDLLRRDLHAALHATVR